LNFKAPTRDALKCPDVAQGGADCSGVVQRLDLCVKGSPHPSTPRLKGFLCPGNSPIDNLQAYPRCRVPAAPLAGALLICIKALPAPGV